MRFIPRRLPPAMALALALLHASAGHAQSVPPPLRAGEAIVKTKDGCGFVVAADAAQYVQKAAAGIDWGGVCVEGLAMGNSQGQGMRGWMYWGRRFGLESMTHNAESHTYFYWDGKTVNIDEMSDVSAHWPAEQKKWDDTAVVYRLFKDVDGNFVVAQKISCIVADIATGAGALRGCSFKKPYGIFRIETRLAASPGASPKSVLCPNPRTPKGCDVLWQQVAGPFFERSKSFVAENTLKAEALQREMPTLIAAAQAAALVAAQQREAVARQKEAEDARVAAEAAAEVERVTQQKEADERQFQQLLERSNAGQLFTLADRLNAEGKDQEAREVRRALISRFPDHALAATAARQLAGNGSTSDSGGSAPSGERAKYPSVCERNWEKIERGIKARGIHQSGYNDLWIRNFNWYAAKVFEPCVATSAGAASEYQSAMKGYNRINDYCAGPHEKWECLQWGQEGGVSDNGGHPYDNPAYYAGWKADVDRALADPNYSADLGSAAAGAGGGVNAADAACEAALKAVNGRFDAARKTIPEGSVVVLSEAILWMTTESIARIDAQCPESTRYRAQARQLRSTNQDTQRTCDAMSSRGACVARLPVREPVSPRPQSVPDQKPLQQAQQASCDEGSGGNWLKCKQEACGRMDGKLETLAGGCVTCYAPGGNANWCPAGAGHDSAQ